jgi:hypothetical protein
MFILLTLSYFHADYDTLASVVAVREGSLSTSRAVIRVGRSP